MRTMKKCRKVVGSFLRATDCSVGVREYNLQRMQAGPDMGLGQGLGQPGGLPEACQRSPRWRPDGRLVSWKPNVEGLAGRAEATQVCSGSWGPGHPPQEGLGLRVPNSCDAAAFEGRLQL